LKVRKKEGIQREYEDSKVNDPKIKKLIELSEKRKFLKLFGNAT